MGSHMQQSGGVPMQQQQQMHYPPAQGQMGEKMLMENGYGMGPSAQPHQTQVQMQMPPQMHFQQMQKQQLAHFWQGQMQEIEQVSDFKTHQLPLARIKKIMKADEDVKMIAAEAPVVFAKACEMFILDLTLRSWGHTEENKRRTLQRNDIAGAVFHGDIFDFLVDIVPRDEPKDEEGSVQWAGVVENGMASHDPSVPYAGMYYASMGQPVMGQPVMGQPVMPVMGQQAMGQQPMVQQPMGQQQMVQQPMGQQPMGQPPMGQQPMGQVPMGPFMGS